MEFRVHELHEYFFSIVIPSYNRASILQKTLQALVASCRNFNGGSEVVVVDDGSSDQTAALVQEVKNDCPVELRYFYQCNRGQGAARNLGARSATGKYLVFLGDDTVPAPDFLKEHARSHSSSEPPRVAIGYTPWPPEFPKTRFMEYIGEKGWQFGFSLIENPQDVPFNFFYTSNLSISREFFWACGGFDEDFQEYGWEDIELSLRLKKKGMRLVFNPKAIAYHYHPTSLASFIKRQRQVGYAAWRFYRKHPEVGDFLGVLKVANYRISQRLKMRLLTWFCRMTEKRNWPDLSRYYPDLMTYYYNLGITKAASRLGQRQ